MSKEQETLAQNPNNHYQISFLEMHHDQPVLDQEQQTSHFLLRIIFLLWKYIKEVWIRISAYCLFLVNSIRTGLNYRKTILKYLVWIVILGLSVRALLISNSSSTNSTCSIKHEHENQLVREQPWHWDKKILLKLLTSPRFLPIQAKSGKENLVQDENRGGGREGEGTGETTISENKSSIQEETEVTMGLVRENLSLT